MKAEKNCDTFSSKVWKANDNICYEKKGPSQIKTFYGYFKPNIKGLMTEEIMGKWLREFWERISGVLLKKKGMLILDTFKIHLTEEVGTLTCDLNTHPGDMP